MHVDGGFLRSVASVATRRRAIGRDGKFAIGKCFSTSDVADGIDRDTLTLDWQAAANIAARLGWRLIRRMRTIPLVRGNQCGGTMTGRRNPELVGRRQRANVALCGTAARRSTRYRRSSRRALREARPAPHSGRRTCRQRHSPGRSAPDPGHGRLTACAKQIGNHRAQRARAHQQRHPAWRAVGKQSDEQSARSAQAVLPHAHQCCCTASMGGMA